MSTRPNSKTLFAAGLTVGLLAIAGLSMWWISARPAQKPVAGARESAEEAVRQLVSSEELLLELTPLLRGLTRSVLNLQLPDSLAKKLFVDRVEINGELALSKQAGQSVTGPTSRPWTVTKQRQHVSPAKMELWKPLFDEAEFIENARFYIVKAEFPKDSFDTFGTQIGFDGLVTYRHGRRAAVHAEMQVDWIRLAQEADPSKADWRIRAWTLSKFQTMEIEQPLYADVLEDAITDPADLARARTSKHEQIITALLSGKEVDRPKDDPYPFLFPEVTLEHPCVSIVDIDGDGWDDLFVGMQHDANLLFRNKGDGTFEEVSSKYGLTTRGDTTSAVFADFDNDGDPDLFLGRARHRSQYLVNEGGKFVDRSQELVGVPLPYLVSSISAADYNGDGLLDVYLATYNPVEEKDRFVKNSNPVWTKYFLPPEEAKRYTELLADSHKFLRWPGPPNMLLANKGNGRFELAKENSQTQLWKPSFQASWCDFDADGDPDLYVANDFGADNLLRNDGAAGFADVTEELGLTRLGFGMGVSWGDYDNDGRFDLYVSNMYSKAGKRITSQVAGIDPRFREMAEGNFLYRNTGGRFDLVSGTGASDLKVAKAGWSWGGQFLDFNNDGFLDLYVASGYYTAPADVALDMDL